MAILRGLSAFLKLITLLHRQRESNPRQLPCNGSVLPLNYPPKISNMVGLAGLEPATSCVSSRHSNQMSYRPFGKELRTFVTNPVYLKQYNNRWFVLSVLEKQGMIYVNAFDRIEDLTVLSSKIAEDISFDADEYFDPIVGVSRPLNGVAEEIVLQLSQELYPYIKTKPIHHSQKNYDDEFKVVIKVIRNKELEMLLNSFGIGLSS